MREDYLPPQIQASELKNQADIPVTAGANYQPPVQQAKSISTVPVVPKSEKSKRMLRQRIKCGNKRGVVTPESRSEWMGGNVRGCRCRAFKISEIE